MADVRIGGKPLPSLARVREAFDYNPTTGALTWRISTGARGVVGGVAGCRARSKVGHRIKVNLDGVAYMAHRIVWLWVTGCDPISRIDHKDMDGTNNRWGNLRLATNSENMGNRRSQANKKSHPLKGAYLMWHGRWYSRIQKDGVDYHLGIFDSAEDAHAAYAAKSKELFGEFARAA